MTAPVRPNPVDDLLAGPTVAHNAVDAMLADHADPMAKWHQAYKSGQLEKEVTAQNLKDQQHAGPTAAGGLATVGSMGGLLTAPQAAVRSVVRGQPYREALSDIQGDEAQTPKLGRLIEGMAGAAPLAAMIPGSPAVAGATLGGATALANPNPDLPLVDRLQGTAMGAGIGAVLGKVGDVGTTTGRGLAAQDLGQNVMARKGAMATADKQYYGAAEQEGNVTSADPAVTAALDKPDIKPYADVIRGSRQFAGANDNTVLREAYKLMSERQGATGQRIANANDFKAGTSLENKDIGLAKTELANAAENTMPSFRTANETHAEHAGQIDAVTQGADDAKRAITGTDITGKKIDKNSLAAVLQRTKGLTPEQAHAAAEGILGRLKDNMGLQFDPRITTGFGLTKGFGIGSSLSNANAVTPMLRAADAVAPPNSLLQLLRAATVAGAGERP